MTSLISNSQSNNTQFSWDAGSLVPPAVFWKSPSFEASDLERFYFECNIRSTNANRIWALFHLAASFNPDDAAEVAKDAIKINQILYLFATTKFETLEPALAGLLLTEYLQQEAFNNGKQLIQELKIPWQRVYRLLAAAFAVTNTYLDDKPIYRKHLADVFQIPLKELERDMFEILSKVVIPTDDRLILEFNRGLDMIFANSVQLLQLSYALNNAGAEQTEQKTPNLPYDTRRRG